MSGAPRHARIPVLLYHAVMAEPPPWIAEFTVSPTEFARQLDAVVASGRSPLTVGALVGLLAAGDPLPPRPVVLTFDDGFADLAGPTAEALAARRLPATAYLTTGALVPGRPCLLPPAPMITLARVPELEAYGMEIGAHTATHPQLDTLAPGALSAELREPKAVLEDVLGHEIRHLAYPHGYNSPAVRRAVRAAGYASAVAVRHALSSETDEPYRIARLIVRRSHTAADVERWMRGEGARAAPYRDSLPTVGWRAYRRARALLRGPEFAG
ncbi:MULTISPECIES: polysaccharide deacetylase family protein [unclassified Streptomyces]|uniref:polysaccharide deacetylase family protein n=1 Tax=unclassified Streptomyces TaxID=2593676 RepID=UPI001CB7118C|nr:MULTISPECIES: polysaccharide deacetylase family protein [unclassified Streptomyces]MBD0708631.1 polysaccharide deacetylase [Streptomyces sp. CBMA291]MBD0713106.1 polysaccharide deacetylase [Streptomyces sp. CBMA370]